MDLDPAFQAEVLEKERALGADHFSVLGLSPSASAEEIRAAYHAASRRFHPDRFFRKELGSFAPKLDRIFQRLNEANAILSDPQKRAAYLAAHPELRPPEVMVSPERMDERRSRFSRHPYLMRAAKGREAIAKAQRLVDGGEASLAMEILNDVLRAEPNNADAVRLLAEARRQLDGNALKLARKDAQGAEKDGRRDEAVVAWQRVIARAPDDAEAHFRLAALLLQMSGRAEQARIHAKKAVDLAPKNAEHRVVFARVLLELGAKKLARKELDTALELAPEHREAVQLIKKVRWSVLGGS